ncbi:UNVERIFIED_CONTAM: hypothetical protein Sradi_6177300 [Sesamum radiatum]|uniref:Uncharacterized protein n=1 Tax=Sesamum radiatum TaxID=300843 RepID=A0AAW2K8F9_SESRA
MVQMKLLGYLLIVTIIMFGIAPENAVEGVTIDPYPAPCSGELCTYLCSKVRCGDYFCPSGYCVYDEEIGRNVCLCNPRSVAPALHHRRLAPTPQ